MILLAELVGAREDNTTELFCDIKKKSMLK